MRVDVYYNLHKHCWSVRHKGKVVAHLDEVFLTDVEFVVQPAGRAKVISEGRKNVHAFARGTWHPKMPEYFDLYYFTTDVSYNPFKADTFMASGFPVYRAPQAWLTPERRVKCVAVYTKPKPAAGVSVSAP